MKLKKQTESVSEIDKIGTVTNKSVLKCTGRGWAEWISVLNGFGAQNLTHKEIVSELRKKKYQISIWWQQGVTTGYEIHIGRKAPGRNAKGLYSMTVTKSLSIGQKPLWQALVSEEGQKIWLKPWTTVKFAPGTQFEVQGGFFGEVRTVKSPIRIRMTWQESEWDKAAAVQIYAIKKGKDKSMLVIMLEGITTAKMKEEMRLLWRKSVDDFVAHVSKK